MNTPGETKIYEVAQPSVVLKRCEFVMTKGYKKGLKCGSLVMNEPNEYCTEHKRVVKRRYDSIKRRTEKWGLQPIAAL